ncbi:hypothetical protein BU17DRAFT_99043 [Hysterangium stoloniferum]|nr:hypothetical protein BU17DRAFT_99043 [Hysterangium stoloniferum]
MSCPIGRFAQRQLYPWAILLSIHVSPKTLNAPPRILLNTVLHSLRVKATPLNKDLFSLLLCPVSHFRPVPTTLTSSGYAGYTPAACGYSPGASEVTQGTPSDIGYRPLITPDVPPQFRYIAVRHRTKPSSPRLSTTSRPRFFLADDSDSDKSPAQRSFRRREIILALPVTNTSRLIGNCAKLPWASLVEKISRYQDPLMTYKLTDFDPDVEIADWNDICTKLETMKAMCKASHSDANLTYDGETKTAGTPRHIKNSIHKDRMEASTTSMQPTLVVPRRWVHSPGQIPLLLEKHPHLPLH